MSTMKEKIEWLAALGERMREQETDCQAAPRFWVVRHEVREYGYSEGYEEGIELEFDSRHYPVSRQKEFFEDVAKTGSEIAAEYRDKIIDSGNLFSNDELRDIIGELSWDHFSCGVIGYCDRYKIAPNTLFLTKEACKTHIAKNDYHYNKPHTYAMTAWRSPEVEKLFSIIEDKQLWNKLLSVLKEDNEEEE